MHSLSYFEFICSIFSHRFKTLFTSRERPVPFQRLIPYRPVKRDGKRAFYFLDKLREIWKSSKLPYYLALKSHFSLNIYKFSTLNFARLLSSLISTFKCSIYVSNREILLNKRNYLMWKKIKSLYEIKRIGLA